MIEDQLEEGPCECCGHDPEDCICPGCMYCEQVGNPQCYHGSKFGGGHDMRYSKAQLIGQAKRKISDLEDKLPDAEMTLAHLESDDYRDDCFPKQPAFKEPTSLISLMGFV
jgi:hypothetical protein